MSAQKPSVVASVYLKRAWKHIISTAILGNKTRALTVVSVGVLTTIIQMCAMLILVMAARAYENKGVVDFGPVHFELSANTSNTSIAIVVGGALLILLLSVFAGLYQQIIITRIGRKFFEETLDDTRGRLRTLAAKSEPYQPARFMQMLQRDSRYLSISYMRTLNLLQPGLLVLVFMSYAIYSMPLVAALLVVGCMAMVPFHIWMSRWSAQTSEDIQLAARQKSEEERAYITSIGSDPFAGDWDERYLDQPRPAGEDGFISAFVKRQRIGAYSQFITDAFMAVIVVILVVVLTRKGGTDILSLSGIMILLILFRLLTGYVSKFAQAVTMVSSYEPFFRKLLDVYDDNVSDVPTGLIGDLRAPVRLVAFQNGALARGDGQFYAQSLGLDGDVYFVGADYETKGRQATMGLEGMDEEKIDVQDVFAFDPKLAAEILAFIEDDTKSLSPRAKYLLSYVAALRDENSVLLISGEMWDKMEKEDMRFMVSSAKDRSLIMVYNRPPGKLVLPLRFQVAVRTQDGLEIVGSVENYRDVRSNIINTVAQARASQLQQNANASMDAVETL